jgi:hypothetical protein
VRRVSPFNRRAEGREVALTFLAAAAALLFVYQRTSFTAAAGPQRRQTQSRRHTRTPPQAKTKRDYSRFLHKDHRGGLKCSNCHTIPSAANSDRVAAATKPSAVGGYPYHDSCQRCHRQQIFKGDRPVFCTVCHSRVSTRMTARDVYSKFPSPKRGDLMAREFPGYFPHGLHQSLMAFGRPRRPRDAGTALSFLRVSFNSAAPVEEPQKMLDSCETCHVKDVSKVLLPFKGLQSEETIEPGTFMTVPGARKADAHAACFNCHWQAQKPTRDDCGGCHLSQADYAARKLEVIRPPALSPNAARWFKDWPAELPKRLSLKFRHGTPDHGAAGCNTCHINIAQMMTLDIPKADVPILSCAPCHYSEKRIPVGATTATIYTEMDAWTKDAARKYKCVACHTSVIGSEQPPCTHYTLFEEPCPEAGRPVKK